MVSGKSKHRNVTTLIVAVTAFSTTFSSSAMNLAIPAMGLEFGSKSTTLGWIVTGYMICVAMFAVPFGRLADLTGRRRIFLLGIIFFTVSNLVTFFAWNLGVVIFLRVMQGLSASMIFSTNNPILIDAYPPQKRGRALGFSVTATYVGLSAGPVFGGLINLYMGWRYIFILTALIGLVAFIAAVINLPKNAAQNKKTEKEAFNLTGNLLYLSTIFFIMYGFTLFNENDFAKFLIPVGIAIGILFVFHELNTENPVVKIELFKGNLTFLLSNVAALFNYGATFAVGYLMSFYLQLVMGFSSGTAGLILIIQPLVMALVSPWSGRASDKVSPFKLASAGMGLCALTLFSYTFMGVEGSIIHVMINLTIIGLGFGLFSSPNTNAIMSCVKKEDYSVASSILATMRTLGHTSSMAVITIIMAAHLGSATLAQARPQQLVDTMNSCFIVFSVICAVGVFISLRRKTKDLKERQNNI